MDWKWTVVFYFCLVIAQAQKGYSPQGTSQARLGFNPFGRAIQPNDVIGDEIPGRAGVDYPVLATVPTTNFRCDSLPWPGYYADQQTGCQAFYICQKGGKGTGFLCPNGTIFNQEVLVCDWWQNVDCARAANFFSVNEAVLRAMEEADARNARQNGGFFNNNNNNNNRVRPNNSPRFNDLGTIPSRFNNGGVQPNSNFGRLSRLQFTTPRSVFGNPPFNNYRQPSSTGQSNNGYNYPRPNQGNPFTNQDSSRYNPTNNDVRGGQRPVFGNPPFNNYRQPSSTGQSNNGYSYPRPNQGNPFTNQDSSRYNPNNNDVRGGQRPVFGNPPFNNYRQPSSTGQSNSGYSYPRPNQGNPFTNQDSSRYNPTNNDVTGGQRPVEDDYDGRYRGDNDNSRRDNSRQNGGDSDERPRGNNNNNNLFGQVVPDKAYLPPIK